MTSRHAGPTMDRLIQQLEEPAESGPPGFAARAPADFLNTYGVLLLRQSKVYGALTVFNEITLDPHTLCVRRDVPDIFKRNLATARLMAGNPLGCLEALRVVCDRRNRQCCRLRQAVRTWNRSLPFLRRLAWRLGILPEKPVRLDFIPGELDDEDAKYGKEEMQRTDS
ncbi:MAG: hypothetical protein LLG01_01135 [Planctomycetaceae bacterium]|nr:hypothetical protein [Planctomycetaceae bacterium]